MVSNKYPRSPHLPWSPGGTSDDKRMLDVISLLGVELVVTEKMDGSNLTYSSSGVFARSHSATPNHPSFAFAKATQANIFLPDGLSVFCEYCYAVHSIEYNFLPNYSLVFGVRDDIKNEWWDWDSVEEMAKEINLPTVPVLFRGTIITDKELEKLTDKLGSQSSFFGGIREGVVIRKACGYSDFAFSQSLAKWVRKNHVQTDEHWKDSQIKPQKLQKTI